MVHRLPSSRLLRRSAAAHGFVIRDHSSVLSSQRCPCPSPPPRVPFRRYLRLLSAILLLLLLLVALGALCLVADLGFKFKPVREQEQREQTRVTATGQQGLLGCGMTLKPVLTQNCSSSINEQGDLQASQTSC